MYGASRPAVPTIRRRPPKRGNAKAASARIAAAPNRKVPGPPLAAESTPVPGGVPSGVGPGVSGRAPAAVDPASGRVDWVDQVLGTTHVASHGRGPNAGA